MSRLAASTAILEEGRLLSQHQAALTLLQASLAIPGIVRLDWLDLACGKGQILAQLDTNLDPTARARISYVGYDLSDDYCRITASRVETLGLQKTRTLVGELQRFSQVLEENEQFDFVTLTNTVHEIEPGALAGILFDCISRLSPTGRLFAYDMEELPTAELGAVPWRRAEIDAIVAALLAGMDVKQYRPASGHWKHKKVSAWNLQVEKTHILAEAPGFATHRARSIAQATVKTHEILSQRLSDCTKTLDTLTRLGFATDAEKSQELSGLYEYWALQRALGKTT
jgi:SAM-dependent methyltransferase